MKENNYIQIMMSIYVRVTCIFPAWFIDRVSLPPWFTNLSKFPSLIWLFVQFPYSSKLGVHSYNIEKHVHGYCFDEKKNAQKDQFIPSNHQQNSPLGSDVHAMLPCEWKGCFCDLNT